MNTENNQKETYSTDQYQRLFNAIGETNGTALVSEMQRIIDIVHEDFPAPQAKEGYSVGDMEEAYQAGRDWEYQARFGRVPVSAPTVHDFINTLNK